MPGGRGGEGNDNDDSIRSVGLISLMDGLFKKKCLFAIATRINRQ